MAVRDGTHASDAGAGPELDEHFLRVAGLGKTFTRRRGRRQEAMQVLDNINIGVRRNEFVTVIGRPAAARAHCSTASPV